MISISTRFYNWRRAVQGTRVRRTKATPAMPPTSWSVFVTELRSKLNADERVYLDRCIPRLDNAARERIARLGIDVAVRELRREIGSFSTPHVTTRSDR